MGRAAGLSGGIVKILYLSGSFKADRGFALARTAVELARGMAGLGHSVHAVTTGVESAAGMQAFPGVQFHFHKSPYPFFAYNDELEEVLQAIPLSSCLTELVKSAGPFDVVHAFGWNAGLSGAFLQRVFGIPFALSLPQEQGEDQGPSANPWQRWTEEMEAWLIERADLMLAGTTVPASARRSPDGISSPRKKSFCLGVRREDFLAKVDLEGFRSLFAAPDRKIALHAGRLLPGEGLDRMVNFFLSPPKGTQTVHLLVAGDGPGRQTLEETVKKAGAGRTVQFLGSVHSIVLGALYQAADVYVDTAHGSPGLAALEASAFGLPVVGIGYGTECAATLPAGVYPCDFSDKKTIAAALKKALDDSRTRPDRLEGTPDWGSAASEITHAYLELRSSSSPALQSGAIA